MKTSRRTDPSMLTCSTCGRRFLLDETTTPPFCSERCKMIDLGRWLDEEVGVPHEGGPENGETVELDDDSDIDQVLQEKHAAKQLEGLTIAYHALGETEKSQEALNELIDKYEFNSAYNIAYVLAYLGESDRAFEWLAKAAEYRDSGLTQMAHQPEFANIHDDPRWQPVLESVGVSPGQLAAIEFNVVLP